MTYKQMGNRQLQRASLDYVRRLRLHGAEAAAATRAALDVSTPGFDPLEPEEARDGRMKANQSALIRGFEEQRLAFNAGFRSDGLLLHDELIRRTGQPRVSLVALEHGLLSGAHPIEDVAHEIERLAKMLDISGEVLPFRVR